MLYENHANPFHPKTTILYSIPQSGFITLKIYEMLGREIRSLVNEIQQGGKYSIYFDVSDFSRGLYFYRLQTGNGFSETKKMLLVK